jgi:hypothetical protein
MGYINRGNQDFGHGCFQTLCDLDIPIFFMVILCCSSAPKVERSYVELFLTHP